MGLLDDYSDKSGLLGLGMTPRPSGEHQEAIALLLIALRANFNNIYKILPESAIDLNNLNSKAPDIVFYKKNATVSCFFIEITTTKETKKIMAKCNQVMKKYNITECLIYDYELNIYHKITAIPHATQINSYSDFLKANLIDYL